MLHKMSGIKGCRCLQVEKEKMCKLSQIPYTKHDLAELVVDLFLGLYWHWPSPNENCALGSSVYREFFFEFHGGFNLFENVKKWRKYKFRFSSANTEDKFFAPFCLFLTKIVVTGSLNFTQCVASVLPTNLILCFFLIKKKIL